MCNSQRREIRHCKNNEAVCLLLQGSRGHISRNLVLSNLLLVTTYVALRETAKKKKKFMILNTINMITYVLHKNKDD